MGINMINKILKYFTILLVLSIHQISIANISDALECKTTMAISGTIPNTAFTGDIQYYNNYAFALSMNGIQVIDMDNTQIPTIIIEKLNADKEQNVSAIQIIGNYLYAFNYHYLGSSHPSKGHHLIDVYDIADILNITHIGELIDENESRHSVSSIIQIDENTIAAMSDHISFYDISTPENIRQISLWHPDWHPEGEEEFSFFGKSKIYQNHIYAPYTKHEIFMPGVTNINMAIIDISNIFAPMLVNDIKNSGVMDVEFDGALAYFASTDKGWEIFDVSDPANPLLMNQQEIAESATTYFTSVLLDGQSMYITNLFSGLDEYNITDPLNPTLVNSIKMDIEIFEGDPSFAFGPLIFEKNGDMALIGSVKDNNAISIVKTDLIKLPQNGSYIDNTNSNTIVPITGSDKYFIGFDFPGYPFSSYLFEISSTKEINKLSQFDSSFPIGIKGDFVFMGGMDTIEINGRMEMTYSLDIYDISAPESPIMIKRIPTASDFLAKFDNDRLYYTETNNRNDKNIHVIDISDPVNAKEIFQFAPDFNGLEFAAINNTIFFLSDNEIVAVDISNPTNPVEISSTHFATSNTTWLETKDGFLYLITMDVQKGESSTINIFDVRTPENMVNIGEYNINPATIATMKMIHDNFIILNTSNQEIEIFDISDPYDLKQAAFVSKPLDSEILAYAASSNNLLTNGDKGIVSFSMECIQSETCNQYSSSLTLHEQNGRAYSETKSGWWWLPGTTNWFATGSDEDLGNKVSIETTLYSKGDGIYTTTACNYNDSPPVISLSGNRIISLNVGDDYIEPGFAAMDDIDGDITDKVIVTGEVDTQTAGTYTLFYSVTDSSGNISDLKIRTINVTKIEGCIEHTSTLQQHEDAYRATSETVGDWWWNTGTTTWYAIGSADELGTTASGVITLHQYKVGVFHKGSCPTPPEVIIHRYYFDGTIFKVEGNASDNNNDISNITIKIDDNLTTCSGTIPFICEVDATTLPAREKVKVEIIATDEENMSSEPVTMWITIPDNFPPKITNIITEVTNINAVISGDIIDNDSNSFEMIIKNLAFSSEQLILEYTCKISDIHFECTITNMIPGSYYIAVNVADDSGNTVNSSKIITVVFIGDNEQCVTSTNQVHVDNGRAISFGSTAVISNPDNPFGFFIGSMDKTTTLQQTDNSYWEEVDSCDN